MLNALRDFLFELLVFSATVAVTGILVHFVEDLYRLYSGTM
jgi:hypothetical protein